jgi:lipopolysaccharide/colanic/teichoic acid biosynthesis glycosyltransferase
MGFPWKFLQLQNNNDLFVGLFGSLMNHDSNMPHESGLARLMANPNACGLAHKELFDRMLLVERRRTERTGDPFALMLVDLSALLQNKNLSFRKIENLCGAIRSETRDSDFDGWYRHPSTIGLIFTTLRGADPGAVEAALRSKMEGAISGVLDSEECAKVVVSFHFYPENNGNDQSTINSDKKLYPDLDDQRDSKPWNEVLKRAVDIAGSLMALVLFSPLFLLIPILIKATSKGPVLFKKPRLGKFGREFKFLKFRTMQVDSDSTIHQKYVQDLIEKKVDKGEANGVFKIVNDPRVTPLGRFLRKTSLDELPQFINVLKGDMSLVGPRPPLPYEASMYHCWHRRRVVEVKPGITGLWQVYGRSRTTFDEMVRLDLQYARRQSLWLDLKLILKTPLAILTGNGAY